MNSANRTSRGQTEAVEVLIAYEAVDAGKAAKGLCDRLQVQLASVCKVSIKLWRFDMLAVSEAAHLATQVAGRSQILIVAAAGAKALPTAVKRVVKSFLRNRRPGDAAVVAQLTEPALATEAASPVYAWLSQATQHARADLFVRVSDGLEEVGTFMERLQHRAERRTSVVSSLLARSLTHRYPIA